jgi:hypothetical protein
MTQILATNHQSLRNKTRIDLKDLIMNINKVDNQRDLMMISKNQEAKERNTIKKENHTDIIEMNLLQEVDLEEVKEVVSEEAEVVIEVVLLLEEVELEEEEQEMIPMYHITQEDQEMDQVDSEVEEEVAETSVAEVEEMAQLCIPSKEEAEEDQ